MSEKIGRPPPSFEEGASPSWRVAPEPPDEPPELDPPPELEPPVGMPRGGEGGEGGGKGGAGLAGGAGGGGIDEHANFLGPSHHPWFHT